MSRRPQHNRALEIAREGRDLESAMLGVKSGAANANSVVSGRLSLQPPEESPGFLSRLLSRRSPRDFAAVGKLNENGTQLETLWVKECDRNGRTKSTLLVRNLGPSGKVYEVTSYCGEQTMEIVTEKNGSLIYRKRELRPGEQ